MNLTYIVLLAIAAFSVSLIGAVFSITGLTHLFAGASFGVGVMAAALEFSKLVVAGFLYRYWGHVGRVMRYYLSAALFVLVCITSMGIFGFLSSAYQKSSIQMKNALVKMDALKSQEAQINQEMSETQNFVDSIPLSRISTRFAFQRQAEKRFLALRSKLADIGTETTKLKIEALETQTKVGPLIYVAETFGADVDSVAKVLIFVFVSVFDPLAICLVFGLGLALRLREKYKGREYKIGELAWSNPVDHRFKKTG